MGSSRRVVDVKCWLNAYQFVLLAIMVAYDQSYYGDSFPVSSLSISIWIKEVPIYKWGIVDGYVHRCLFSVHCHLFCVNLMKGFPLIGWA